MIDVLALLRDYLDEDTTERLKEDLRERVRKFKAGEIVMPPPANKNSTEKHRLAAEDYLISDKSLSEIAKKWRVNERSVAKHLKKIRDEQKS